MQTTTYYEVLGVSPDASQEAIKAAWTAAMKANHPDRVGPADEQATGRAQLFNKAYETLRDPVSRASYDALLAAETNPVSPVAEEPVSGQAAYVSPEQAQAWRAPQEATRRSDGWDGSPQRRFHRSPRWSTEAALPVWLGRQWMALFEIVRKGLTADTKARRILKWIGIALAARFVSDAFKSPIWVGTPLADLALTFGSGMVTVVMAAIPAGLALGVYQALRLRAPTVSATEESPARRWVAVTFMALNGALVSAVAVAALAALGTVLAYLAIGFLLLRFVFGFMSGGDSETDDR